MKISIPTSANVFLTLLTAYSINACNDKKSDSANSSITTLTLKIRNADGPAALVEKSKASNLHLSGGAGNLSFTPDSYKLWINTIVLQNDSDLSNQFYQCETSEADCEVDFGSASSIAAFEAKLSSLSISPGTYTKVWLSCAPQAGGFIKFKGKATLANGDIKYTSDADSNNGDPITTDVSKWGEVKLSATTGCGLTMRLSKPLVVAQSVSSDAQSTSKEVAAGSTLTMTLFSNLKDVIYYGPNLSGGMGGCAINRSTNGGPGFCMAYPSVFPYFGETAPTVEYFEVAHSKTSSDSLTIEESNVLVKVIKDSDGTPFWASFNNIYGEDTLDYGVGDKGISGYANTVSSFAVNADGTLTIKSQENGFAAFSRSGGTGTVKGEEIVNGAGTGVSVDYYYKAFPYTP